MPLVARVCQLPVCPRELSDKRAGSVVEVACQRLRDLVEQCFLDLVDLRRLGGRHGFSPFCPLSRPAVLPASNSARLTLRQPFSSKASFVRPEASFSLMPPPVVRLYP